ncbi:MAG: molybdopterin biosynthesis protein [Thermoleophilia bacterium]|nr:molybdopterin biosynthesis protein [Thermoleophilia bacterium]
MKPEPDRIVYLRNISLSRALDRWLGALAERGLLDPLPAEPAPVDDSLGRVTARPLFALKSSPWYHGSAMDGFAVRFASTFGASEASPRRLRLGEDAVPVDTGDPLPEGFNAVIMVEDTDQSSDVEIEITAPATPWQHVRTVGEDIVATELVLPENHLIRPVDQAALLAGGLTKVDVHRRPRVTIIPTGSELVEPGRELEPGNIIEFNSRLLAGMASGWGAGSLRHGIVGDVYADIRAALAASVRSSDVVLVNAGSSSGRDDYTVHVIAELGNVLTHGVRIRPGKPVILGIVDDTPVVGVPGYPVSAALVMDLFVRPLVYSLQGLKAPERQKVTVRITRKIPSGLGAEEFIRVKMGRVGKRLVAAPIERGAGALMSLVRADGILRIPENSEGVKPKEDAEIELLRSLDEVENTIVAVGSHDISLDLLASELKKKRPELTLSSAHVGSLGGLMALKRGEAHMAGTHLLDEETGEYNVSYVRRYLPGMDVTLVNLAYREQGLIVAKGNPLGIRGVEDLAREGLAFINRQRGAGTRILLDYKLRVEGIDPAAIQGYSREEYTHMSVAAAVLDGAADTGMGIKAAADALDLDFVPVTTERYDLAIPAEFTGSRQIEALLEVLNSANFQAKVEALGGYDTSRTGEVRYCTFSEKG